MDFNYFKDMIFEFLNESDSLDVADIETNDKAGTFLVTMHDGAKFEIQVSELLG